MYVYFFDIVELEAIHIENNNNNTLQLYKQSKINGNNILTNKNAIGNSVIENSVVDRNSVVNNNNNCVIKNSV